MTVEKQNADDETDHPKKRSCITIYMSPELLRRVSIAALQNDLSISEYIRHVLEVGVPDEASIAHREWQPINREAVERLKKLSEEIIQDRGGKLFEDSVELIRQQREERMRELMGEL